MSRVNKDSDLIDIMLNKYVNHYPSLLKIKVCFNEPTEFDFREVIPNNTEKEIKNLDSLKKGTFKRVHLIENVKVYA